ncbi:MAG: zinc-binding dehydrogenase, partial [Clostridiales bacterium]|nr:zinc-binding dehydrogenase [Clostridiales bacterium]
LNGEPHFCTGRSAYGGRPGMAENIVWHESQMYKLPDDVSLRNGCLLEPLSISLHMVDMARIKLGARVAVSGGGPIGQLALQCARAYGATSLTMIEPVANRRELAVRFGAVHTIDPVNQNVQEEAMKITNERGFDVVLDATGVPAAVEVIPPMMAKGGTMVFAAMYPIGYMMPYDLYNNCYRNELTLVGSHLSPNAFPRSVQMLSRLDLDPFTETVFPLEKAAEAFDVHMTSQHPKIVVKCNDLE